MDYLGSDRPQHLKKLNIFVFHISVNPLEQG
ncbi:hypothetical protein T05_4795 [Trichinella murrelli]|uniref:Uncharacterized protein n=1 Tax=Trichinella murrelli TaxID=144512 RepID=A0A0V0SRZ4_9BILA|nr:hypothetical protein T05_4795 [Trichinella murrelli]